MRDGQRSSWDGACSIQFSHFPRRADEKCIKLISLDFAACTIFIKGNELQTELHMCQRVCMHACVCGTLISHFATSHILQNLNRRKIHFGNENHALLIKQRRSIMGDEGGWQGGVVGVRGLPKWKWATEWGGPPLSSQLRAFEVI